MDYWAVKGFNGTLMSNRQRLASSLFCWESFLFVLNQWIWGLLQRRLTHLKYLERKLKLKFVSLWFAKLQPAPYKEVWKKKESQRCCCQEINSTSWASNKYETTDRTDFTVACGSNIHLYMRAHPCTCVDKCSVKQSSCLLQRVHTSEHSRYSRV